VRHGFDWHRFLAVGVPIEQIEATGDAMALKVAAEARRQAEEEATRGR